MLNSQILTIASFSIILGIFIVISYKNYYESLSLGEAFFIINLFFNLETPLRLVIWYIFNSKETSVTFKRFNEITKFPSQKNDYFQDEKTLEKGTIIVQNGTFAYHLEESLKFAESFNETYKVKIKEKLSENEKKN